MENLKKKGYACEAIDDTNALGNIQPTQIPFLDTSRISKIGPIDANWILVPVVIELLTGQVGITRNYAEIVCYLYEKPTGKLIWEGRAYFGGPLRKTGNLHGAINKLMKEFPSNK